MTTLSLPQFHRPLLCLALHDLGVRRRVSKKTPMSINCKSAELLVSDLQVGDLKRAATAMSQGMQGGSAAARAHLSKVKTVAGSLPHASEAAGKACIKMEGMHHNLSPPRAFLTAALNNINCFLLQTRSGELIDSIEDVGQVTDDELW